MKRYSEVPQSLLESILREQKERQRESQMVLQQYKHYCTLPVRPARMKLLRIRENREDMEQTIVPATSVYLGKKPFLDADHLNRDAITYTVAGTKEPFPYGHIYQGSGHICLGSIFVPAKVSRFTPQQPLETLFLHNDRKLSHGGARLFLDEKQVQQVRFLLADAGIDLSVDADESLKAENNMLKTDGIWLIGADVYQQMELRNALRLMEKIYQVIFQQKGQTE